MVVKSPEEKVDMRPKVNIFLSPEELSAALAVHVAHLAEIACAELPAHRVNPSDGELQWFIDRAAAAESGFPSTMV